MPKVGINPILLRKFCDKQSLESRGKKLEKGTERSSFEASKTRESLSPNPNKLVFDLI